MSKGIQTRTTILSTAAQLASQQGLDGLSIGTLADSLGMSRSGVFAHFGSKEELQTATLDHAWDIMATHLRHTAQPGLERLQATLEGWLGYLEHCPFPGGCLFMAASSELDGRPGKVRNHLLSLVVQAVNLLLEQVATAQKLGQLRSDVPVAQIVFELHAFLQAANNAYQLSRDASYFALARHSIHEHLERWRTPEHP